MNIIVDLNYPIKDGTEVVFRSPVDCSQVTGLLVNYQDNENCSKEFAFADAHGNNVGDIDHLFAENVAVKVILDVKTGMAFVQNADTNAYLEYRMGRIAHPVTGDEFNGLALEEKLVPGDSYLITEDATTDDLVTKGKIFRAKDKVNFGYIMSVGGGGSSVGFGYGVPNDETEGEKGTFYFDEYDRELYLCHDIGAYGERFWHKISADEETIVQSVLDALPNGDEVSY